MSPAGNLLAGKVGAVRAHLQRRAALAVALWAGAALGVALAAAWLLAGPGGWRQGSAAPLVLDLVALAAAGAVVLGTRVALGRRLAEAPLAFAMEAAAGLRPGVVRGALELGRAVPGGVSPALVEHAAVQAAEALAAPPAALAGSLGAMVGRWLRRGAAAAAGVAVVLTLLAASAPTRAARAWGGLSSPLGVLARPVLPPLSVTPGSAEVPRGADVVVRVEAPGRAVAELAWQAVGDVPRVDTLELEEGAGMRVFRALSSPVEYRARTADGAFTETFRLVPVDPLFIGEWSVQVVYPPHTGLPPEEHRGSVGALRLPEGTRLVVEGRASRPLSRAALLASDGTPALELTVAGSRFEGAWVPERSGVFPWRVEDVAGSGAETLPEPLEIRLVPDSTPEVGIPLPGRDTVLTLSLKQPLVLQARDDHGLRRLELVAYRVTAAGSSEEPRVQGLELQGTRAALARPLLDLSGWKLLPGDQVRYFARATDNAPHPGTGRSPEYALRMPDASELRREAGELLGAAAARLDELAAEAQRRAEETRDLQREAAAARPQEPGRPDSPDSGARMGYKEQEELRKALEGQQDLTAEVEALRAELAALQQAMEDAGQADPDLRRDLEELRRLMEQIAGEAEQDRLDELARGLQGQDPREADRSLRDLGREQDGLRERLERSLERFRRAALEQELRATRADAEELADRERALAAAMKEGDRPELRAAQQAALEDEARDLLARMDSLQGSLGGRGEREAARGAARAREEAVLARERMAEAREEAKRGQGARAGEKAGEAAARQRSAPAERARAQRPQGPQPAQTPPGARRPAWRPRGGTAPGRGRRPGTRRIACDPPPRSWTGRRAGWPSSSPNPPWRRCDARPTTPSRWPGDRTGCGRGWAMPRPRRSWRCAGTRRPSSRARATWREASTARRRGSWRPTRRWRRSWGGPWSRSSGPSSPWRAGGARHPGRRRRKPWTI